MAYQKQILIVEDNALNRAMLSAILSDTYQVLEAENGQEALDILQRHKDHVALILLDVIMPVMDGYTFLNRVKEDAELALIPVIVTTQGSSEADEVSALAHGATDFVPKPYRPQVILHRVASIIKLRETAAMVNQFQFDRLTGLYSKEFFYQKVRERLEEDPEQEYTIVCSNIENFKLYNDTFGREAGDTLLKEVAGVAQGMLVESGFCGRFSADRFIILQKREQEQQDRLNFGSFTEQEVSPLLRRVVMRWGIYHITDRSIPVEQMCDRAMLAVDSIKGQYNQYFAVYDDALRGKLLRENAISDAMESALAEGQFLVYLQPKYSLGESRMAGAEALVRWIHPEWGFMSPGEFIPLFEKNGFIPRLDQYVWEQVCMLLRDWRDRGLPALPVSVNVSRADVYQLNLVEILPKLTERYGVEPGQLHLEITESAYAETPSQIVGTVEALRKLGFIVEMDDFGSGYSSLNMLSQMQLDILKLDMKFIQNELAKPMEQSILNDVISMAHRMGLSVVAEGVETQEQTERLRELGCDYVQGYYFAKPMPAGDYETMLRAQSARTAGAAEARECRKQAVRSLLVVDEDPAYRGKVSKTFAGEYRVLEAADGAGALAALAAHGAEGFAAVILSITLPENGAAAVLKALREDPAFWHIPVLAAIPSGDSEETLPLAMKTDDFLCKCHPQFDLRRRINRLIGMAVSRERESVLREAAGQDYMTGLHNRRGLQDAVSALRMEELPLAVCMFDLDDLKGVNDARGHEAGDRMILGFAELLRRHTGPEDILCRYGGDEFLVIRKHVPDAAAAMEQATAICGAFRAQFTAEGLQAACSGGVVLCGRDEKPSDRLIERADQALYRAKRENKGGCCLWQE